MSYFKQLPLRTRKKPIIPVILIVFIMLWVTHVISAYNLFGQRWPFNQQIVMYLQVGSGQITLIDGFTSWNQSASDGLDRWNQLLGSGVQFATGSPNPPIVSGDGKNSVFFSSTFFGVPWGSDVLATTQLRWNGSTNIYTESDVVFNSTKSWNSYRGPLRSAAGGGTLHDFHRVAIHEFGHALGLNHSDDTTAIMAPFESNTDSIQADDAAGVQAIYGGGGSGGDAKADLNGDGKGDIVWQHTSGARAVWFMNGTTVGQSVGLGTVTTAWSIAGSGDLDGNGKGDIVWQHTSGSLAVWFMNGSTVVQSVGIGAVDPAWRIAGSGDLDGNGKGDIVWQHTSGSLAVWFMNGSTLVQSVGMGAVNPAWKIVGSGDLDGNGKSDIVWQHNSGSLAVWFMNGSSVMQSVGLGVVNTTWRIVGSGDFDANGKSDILWENTSGALAVWLMNGSTLLQSVGMGAVDPAWSIRNY